MSDALPKQTPTEQPEAKPEVPPSDQPGSELPEAEAKADQAQEQEQEQEQEEEEEEGECGFCLFMKGGGCRDSFIEWEKCVEEAEKNKEDILEKCVQVTAALKQCMDAHSDYYEPILRAERAAEQQAIEELEKEKEREKEARSEQDSSAEANPEDRVSSDSNQK